MSYRTSRTSVTPLRLRDNDKTINCVVNHPKNVSLKNMQFKDEDEFAYFMRTQAVAKRTQLSRRYNQHYFRMCKEKQVEPIIEHNLALRMSRYIAWLYHQTNRYGRPLTAGVASACVTQAGALWVEHGVSWTRKNHPGLRLQINFFQRH